MKTTTFILAVLFAASNAVIAKSCNQGGVYCGSSLLRKGNYELHIINTIQPLGVDIDDAHIQDSLFYCLSSGDIQYVNYCNNGCGGTDSENPDYCL